MGIFSRSPRRTHPRYSAGTNSTLTEPGINRGYTNGAGHHSVGHHGVGSHTDHTVGHHGVGHGTDHTMGHHGVGHNTDHTMGPHRADHVTDHNMAHHGVGHGTDHTAGRHGSRGLLGRRDRHRGSGFGSRSHNEKIPRAKRERRPLFDINSGHYNRRPSFGSWLKATILDIVTMAAMGAVGLGVYWADPAPSRSFPVVFANGQIVYPQFAYPLRKEIIPIWAAALLAALVPIFIILVMQIRVKSFWDVNNGIIGLLYSLIGAAVFQVFVKWLIGGLRPHFLDVCQPDPAKVVVGGNGYQSLMFTPDVCTGDRKKINDSLESMPSGHSTAAWAGFLYLYFYLNAKLKVFSNHHPAMWKLIALYAPLLGATLITGALTIDEFHNWYDCLAGAVIGSVFAISAYRMVYASVWDFRFNHIPLTRHTPFSYGAGAAGAGGFESAVFTHKAGWGYEEAYGGAPFDSAFALRGMGGGMGGGAMSTGAHTVGMGHKHHRDGDIEHHANGVGTTTGGVTHHNEHNRGGLLGGLGRHHDRDVGHHDTYNTTSGVTHPTATHTSGLTHHATTHDSVHDPAYDREGRSMVAGDNNRYRSHRKSLERKAIANRNEPVV